MPNVSNDSASQDAYSSSNDVRSVFIVNVDFLLSFLTIPVCTLYKFGFKAIYDEKHALSCALACKCVR